MFATDLSLDMISSPSDLLGSVGRRGLVDSINSALGSSGFFGGSHDMFASMRNVFQDHVIVPMVKASENARRLMDRLFSKNEYRPLTTEQDLAVVPDLMKMPILMYEPVLSLFKQGRINGFGFDVDCMPDEDVFGRLISNGRCDDIAAALDENGTFELSYQFFSDDPVISFDELDAIEDTRNFIDKFLKDSDLDPTDYPSERG